MLDAIRAEALKMRAHRGTWAMVWIYPILIGALLVATLLYYAVSGSQGTPAPSLAEWLKDTTLFWHAPGSGPGRILVAAFTALVFAGEYNWNTWKLIVPVRRRWQLMAAKWLVIVAFVWLALLLTSLIVLLGEWLRALQGAAIPDGVTLNAIVQAHARAAAYALIPIVYAVSFASLFALLTKSLLASVVLSIGLVIVEGLLSLLSLFAYQRAPGITRFLIETTPPYHMENMTTWAYYDYGFELMLNPQTLYEASWGTSLAMVLGWSFVATALALTAFLRQDMN